MSPRQTAGPRFLPRALLGLVPQAALMRVALMGAALMRAALMCVMPCAILGACAVSQEQQEDAARRPQALLDAYLIAHGMAASYAESPDAKPAVVVELAKLDMRAAQSVRALAKPYDADMDATASAVAALTDYAARQSTAATQ